MPIAGGPAPRGFGVIPACKEVWAARPAGKWPFVSHCDGRIGVVFEPLADMLVELRDRSVDDGDLLRDLGDELRAHRLGP